MSTHIEASDELMEKLAKLLRKGNDKRISPEEAALFLSKAKELAEKHQIDLAMVSLEQKDKSSLGVVIEKKAMRARSQHLQIYHFEIWQVFRNVFGVRAIYFSKRNPSFILVGEATDVLVCTVLLPWLEDLYFTTYNEAAKNRGLRRCAATKRGIYMGLTRGISQANKKDVERSQEEKQTLALVVRKKEDLIEQEMKDTKKTKRRECDVDMVSFMHGVAEGRKVKLDQLAAPTTK